MMIEIILMVQNLKSKLYKKRVTKRSKLKDTDECKIDSKIAQESIRNKVIKQTKRSSNVKFSNSTSMKRSISMQSSRKKKISVNTDNTFDLVNFEELHTDSESTPNDNKNLTLSSLLFNHYNEVNESGESN